MTKRQRMPKWELPNEEDSEEELDKQDLLEDLEGEDYEDK